MRKLKVPGRIIGREHRVCIDFADPNTDLPLRIAQPARFTKAFGWLREVSMLERLTNLLGLNKSVSGDVDIDGRDRAGMPTRPPIAPEDEIRKALFLKVLENMCHSCSGRCTSKHKCHQAHLPREYWLSYCGAGVTGKNRVN